MKTRRNFLKNTALTSLGLGLFSTRASSNKNEELKNEMSQLNCDTTTLDYYGKGPFYTENPPMLQANKLANEEEEGVRLTVSGRVYNIGCTEYLPNTIIDVWHADHNGAYDNQGYNLRGYTTANEQGFYVFETILPGKYLNGSKYRPSHIHFKITPPGFDSLITQLYFEGDSDIPEDAAASINSGTYDASHRIIELTGNEDSLEGVFDIVINGSGTPVGVSDLHLQRGMIYSVGPNPFRDELLINYGVFKNAKVGLVVYDYNGKQVAELENRKMTPEKYTAIWRPDSSLSSGHYFIAIKINDIQVHYLKVIKL